MNPARPMTEGHRTRTIVARVIVAVLLGIATGYAVGTSLASDAARGRALTIKEYVANFDEYKKHLLGNDSPMWAAVIMPGSTGSLHLPSICFQRLNLKV